MSKLFLMQVSIPNERISTFNIPRASISSLSQAMTVRSSIEAFSIGTNSSKRPSVITKPPTCWLKCLGKPIISSIILSVRFKCQSDGFKPISRIRFSSNFFVLKNPHSWDDKALTVSLLRPIAVPTSRTARLPL